MKKDIVSVIAAAALALGVGASGSGCVTALERAKVNSAIEHKEKSLKQDLEDIAKSVFCVRNTVTYRRVGAGLDEKPLERVMYGTAMAYASRDGRTYLVTNNHVAVGEENYTSLRIVPRDGRLVFESNDYVKLGDNLTLVDDRFDKVKTDDVPAVMNETDKKLDIAVLSTDRTLPVSGVYIRNDNIPPKEWDDVYLIGFPHAIMKARTRGSIAHSALKLPKDAHKYHAIDVTGTFGNSGSSYFFRKGNQLYWGGVIRAMLPLRYTRATLLGVPLKDFSDMLARHAYLPIGVRGGVKKK